MMFSLVLARHRLTEYFHEIPQTMQFTLPAPFAPFLFTLANNGASIINPAVLKANSDDEARGYLAQHIAGSGAYLLQRW